MAADDEVGQSVRAEVIPTHEEAASSYADIDS